MLSLEQKREFLGQTDIFAGLDGDTVTLVAGRSGEISLKKGEILFGNGDEGDTVYLIIDGSIEIYREKGNNTLVLANLKKGAMFGEMSVLGQGFRTSSARALEDCSLIFIKEKALKLLVQRVPDVAFNIFSVLIQRLREADDFIEFCQLERDPLAALTFEADGAPQEYQVKSETLNIGSCTGSIIEDGLKCIIPMAEEVAESCCARLELQEGQFFLTSVSNINVVSLAEVVLTAGESVQLTDGDNITIGDLKLTFRSML